MSNCISLNGEWLYRIGDGVQTPVTVPFSHLPVGRSECVRFFDIPQLWDRSFLKFDGITYYAKVFFNGVALGEMLPYCEYEFEITEWIKEKQNELRVELEDIDRAFGPSEGWENFGGIIRDVSVILRRKHYIQNVFFKATPKDDFTGGEFGVAIEAECSKDAQMHITLSKEGKPVCTYVQAPGEELQKNVDHICLWSPAAPELYSLTVQLVQNGRVEDTYTCQVGFRFLSCDRHRILLNGTPLFLKGVCKHEMIGASGHCPTAAQMESDMRMIKEMGCNFVRLVHYPHNKKILEIADRIGLFVSEEPGLWWSDTSNEEIAEGSKEVLRRTILRDRNHPSIAFWLCFNECYFTERYLMESAAICRQYDPTRMVSGANCMSNEDTYLYYNKCGFDFYTMHPYSDTFAMAKESAKVLFDKPLIFTEWGGYFVYDNPHLLLDFMKEMQKLYFSGGDDGALAGAFFWFFAELNDFNRGEPACIDGVLREGLVDQQRNPTLIYDAFCRGLKLFDAEPLDTQHPFWFEKAEGYEDLSAYQKLCPGKEEKFQAIWEPAKKELSQIGTMRKRQLSQGPVLAELSPLDAVPRVLTGQQPLVFPCGQPAQKITVIGAVSLKNGYPLGGEYAETVCSVNITYKSGFVQTVPLKNGIHITTVFGLNRSSRIDPVASQSQRYLSFGYDRNFENYILNRLDITPSLAAQIRNISFVLENERYLPLIYGVFLQ